MPNMGVVYDIDQFKIDIFGKNKLERQALHFIIHRRNNQKIPYSEPFVTAKRCVLRIAYAPYTISRSGFLQAHASSLCPYKKVQGRTPPFLLF